MSKITVGDVVKKAVKNKPVSVKQVKKYADKEHPELGIREKDINEFLYSEYYDDIPYGSIERFERIK